MNYTIEGPSGKSVSFYIHYFEFQVLTCSFMKVKGQNIFWVHPYSSKSTTPCDSKFYAQLLELCTCSDVKLMQPH